MNERSASAPRQSQTNSPAIQRLHDPQLLPKLLDQLGILAIPLLHGITRLRQRLIQHSLGYVRLLLLEGLFGPNNGGLNPPQLLQIEDGVVDPLDDGACCAVGEGGALRSRVVACDGGSGGGLGDEAREEGGSC